MFGILVGPPDQYLTLTLRGLGFDTFNSNLLSIPSQVLGIITAWNERTLLGLFAQVWILPNIIALAVLPSGISPWVKYAVVTVLLSYPYPHAIQVGWCSRNSNTVRARTVSAAVYNMFVQISGIAYSNIYRADDKPEFSMDRRGNTQLVAICSAIIVIYLLVKLYYIWRNKKRDTEWNGMTREQIHYLETTADQGSKRKDFRFAH
ncbi:hypothetical protein F4677DRAFT_452504 [Hypoxylon crocopeplum]|nr:hypothetical protein F4677DRAFT_452504 [Hypoxylon crocopeplum]